MTEVADLVEDKANHILSGVASIDLPDEIVARLDAPFSRYISLAAEDHSLSDT
jgi:hypothetical protein